MLFFIHVLFSSDGPEKVLEGQGVPSESPVEHRVKTPRDIFFEKLMTISQELARIEIALNRIADELKKIGKQLQNIGEKLAALQKKLAETPNPKPHLEQNRIKKEGFEDKSREPVNIKGEGGQTEISFIKSISPDGNYTIMENFNTSDGNIQGCTFVFGKGGDLFLNGRSIKEAMETPSSPNSLPGTMTHARIFDIEEIPSLCSCSVGLKSGPWFTLLLKEPCVFSLYTYWESSGDIIASADNVHRNEIVREFNIILETTCRYLTPIQITFFESLIMNHLSSEDWVPLSLKKFFPSLPIIQRLEKEQVSDDGPLLFLSQNKDLTLNIGHFDTISRYDGDKKLTVFFAMRKSISELKHTLNELSTLFPDPNDYRIKYMQSAYKRLAAKMGVTIEV